MEVEEEFRQRMDCILEGAVKSLPFGHSAMTFWNGRGNVNLGDQVLIFILPVLHINGANNNGKSLFE